MQVLMWETAILLIVAGKILNFPQRMLVKVADYLCRHHRGYRLWVLSLAYKVPVKKNRYKDWFRNMDDWPTKGNATEKFAHMDVGQKWDGKQLLKPAVLASCS